MGVMAAANALNATTEWYSALCVAEQAIKDVGEVGWEMLHHVMIAKAAHMPVPDSWFKVAWDAAGRVKGREDARRSLELMESAGDKTLYGGDYIQTYPMESVVVELLGSALANGEMADVERAIAVAKETADKEAKTRNITSHLAFGLTRTVLSTVCCREHLEQALRMLDYYDDKPGDAEIFNWYNSMWTACFRFTKHNDRPFLLRVIVDEFVNVRKHNTLGFLMHRLSGRSCRLTWYGSRRLT
jgi:hypothetical protein